MSKQKKIREGIARNSYLWASMMAGKESIESFNNLSEGERKPYYVLAHQLSIYLNREGVVIKVDRELPCNDCDAKDVPDRCCDMWCKKLKEYEAGYEATEPLIKEE